MAVPLRYRFVDREPSAPRPFRAVGYPAAPAIFILASLAIVVNALYRDPGPTGAGLIVIGAGVPLYLWFTRRKRLS
jgi:APA family basic amino acid/polyamine antiporter